MAIMLHKPFPGASSGTLTGVIPDSEYLDGVVARPREAAAQVEGPWARCRTIQNPRPQTA